MKNISITKICLLGFGEVGQVLARGLHAHAPHLKLRVTDKLLLKPGSRARRAMADYPGIEFEELPALAVQGCELVISAVTAGQALAAAESLLSGLEPGAFFLDLNSVSPGTKQRLAQCIDAEGGRFVEASIMSPIEPARLQSPILLGGPHAQEFLPLGQALGFSGMRFCSEQVGRAAATKMCRSVMIKGMEALIAESLLSARHYGVESAVLESLSNLFPMPDWPAHARYMISRSVEHGARRAEEMREVARTVQEAGISPHMSSGCVERQEWAAGFKPVLQHQELVPMLNAILDQINELEKIHE
ncbi:NAD(P)-dependent oxidoreductase [Microbulbifer pacificus]|uniref:DUF1932 domain-containing protein n=1 Tax=Microbulbifer pacificus TaxID=407164 RepID=A0AAU0N219_9GAMM|nr:DUF1932 domain-containing protein [Microbulbifer pacificus]WOX07002.1 DUF1932 domain-containing protein [Microbulbifer pacificus]